MVGPRGRKKRLAHERAEGERVGRAGWAEAEDERAGALGYRVDWAKQATRTRAGQKQGGLVQLFGPGAPFLF